MQHIAVTVDGAFAYVPSGTIPKRLLNGRYLTGGRKGYISTVLITTVVMTL